MKKIVMYKNKNKLCTRCLGEIGDKMKDLDKSTKFNKDEKGLKDEKDIKDIKEDLKGFS